MDRPGVLSYRDVMAVQRGGYRAYAFRGRVLENQNLHAAESVFEAIAGLGYFEMA